jgi:hypothetical protein
MHRSKPALLIALAATVGGTQAVSAGVPSPRAGAAAAGGFSVSPSILEMTARQGASGAVSVTNETGAKLKVTVRARPWNQARSGTVSANRAKTLSRVRVNVSSFSMPAGARRSVSVSLTSVPSAGSVYGGLEIVGKPAKRRKGINVAYRLVSSMRFNPVASARKFRLTAGSARVTGSGSSRAAVLTVRNRGNTVEPVAGTVRVTGPGTGRSGSVKSVRILPGKKVDVRLASASGLRAGAYKAVVKLTQGGQVRLNATRSFRVG